LANQTELLYLSKTKISQVLGIPITQTFVPPYNAWNTDTVTALTAENFTVFSSQTDLDPPPYYLSGQTLYHFPIYASTSDNAAEAATGAYIGVPWNQTYNDILTQLGQYGFAAGTYWRFNGHSVISSTIDGYRVTIESPIQYQ
jgi:hypothetical protein